MRTGDGRRQLVKGEKRERRSRDQMMRGKGRLRGMVPRVVVVVALCPEADDVRDMLSGVDG